VRELGFRFYCDYTQRVGAGRRQGGRLLANLFTWQNLFEGMTAHACVAFQPSNSDVENVLFDIFAYNYLFRLLIFARPEFNETQILGLLPSAVGFLSNLSA
jgi:hypothetical protein